MVFPTIKQLFNAGVYYNEEIKKRSEEYDC